MLALVGIVAQGAVPEPWKPVEAELPPWAVRSGTVWVRDGGECLPAKVADAARAAFVVRACEEPVDELVCEVRFSLAGGWAWQDQRCRLGLTGPAGTRTFEPAEPPWVLIGADDTSAAWSPPVELAAVVGRPMIERRPCEPESLAALQKDAKKAVGKDLTAQAMWLAERDVIEGERRCDASEGVSIVAIVPGITRTVKAGTRQRSSPIDCREACPEPPAIAAVAAAEAEVAGRTFYDPAASTIRLYPTKTTCEASPEAEARIPRDLCSTLGAQLRQQAK